jgi:hypothetical protein
MKASNQLLNGNAFKTLDVVGVTLERTALTAGGIAAAGLWSDRTWRNALSGATLIQLVVLMYSYGTGSKDSTDLPSWAPAKRLVHGDWSAIFPIASTVLGRSVLLAAGMYVAGEREKLVEQSLAGSVALELSVLLKASLEKDEI